MREFKHFIDELIRQWASKNIADPKPVVYIPHRKGWGNCEKPGEYVYAIKGQGCPKCQRITDIVRSRGHLRR